MSDNIPLDIQKEIIKKVSDVKSLIRFRSVSKQLKSFIDSSQFIKSYGARHTHPHSRILSLSQGFKGMRCLEISHLCLVDDDIETFKVQQQEFAPFIVSPLLKQFLVLMGIGASHGLVCLSCYNKESILAIWNPSNGKSFGIALPRRDPLVQIEYGFGVCPVTSDPTVVKLLFADNMPWHVEVFTLSSGVWNVIPSANLPRQSIRLDKSSTQVIIDRFIYWGAQETTFTDDGKSTTNPIVVSFDLTTKEFKVVKLPDTLTNESSYRVSVSKLRGSLVVYGSIGLFRCGVWVMEHDSSFRKLFTIGAWVSKILGFTKNDEPIFEIEREGLKMTTLNVYDPCSNQIKNLEISGVAGSFFMGSYKESLLLLDHLDSHIYYGDDLSK